MLVLLTSTARLCFAQGEHGRRAGAELQVLLGDIRKVADLAAINTTALHDSEGQQLSVQNKEVGIADKDLIVKGLVDRIQGSLAALDILFRLADQEANRPAKSYSDLIREGITFSTKGQWVLLEERLSVIEGQFPLVLPQLPESTALLDSSRQLHQRLCVGCHDNPVTQVKRPAYNLYEQSMSISDIEFFARMLVGVRGDRVTGIDNPFTDAELAGLIAFYKSDND